MPKPHHSGKKTDTSASSRRFELCRPELEPRSRRSRLAGLGCFPPPPLPTPPSPNRPPTLHPAPLVLGPSPPPPFQNIVHLPAHNPSPPPPNSNTFSSLPEPLHAFDRDSA